MPTRWVFGPEHDSAVFLISSLVVAADSSRRRATFYTVNHDDLLAIDGDSGRADVGRNWKPAVLQ